MVSPRRAHPADRPAKLGGRGDTKEMKRWIRNNSLTSGLCSLTASSTSRGIKDNHWSELKYESQRFVDNSIFFTYRDLAAMGAEVDARVALGLGL